jgi:hypothetical protein
VTVTATSGTLPKGFDQLEPWAAAWVLPDAQARMTKRQSSSFAELQEFYNAMVPLGEAALFPHQTSGGAVQE